MPVAGPKAPPFTVAIRLALFYAAFFAVVGVHMPFWPVWLASRGIGAAEIGVILAATVSVKVVSAPMLAHVAAGWGERRRVIMAVRCAARVRGAPPNSRAGRGSGGVLCSLRMTSVVPLPCTALHCTVSMLER